MEGSGSSDVSAMDGRALGLHGLPLVGTYSTGDNALRGFYLPALAASCAYDRMAGYYSSTVLRITARGLRRFLTNAQDHGGRMRLIVGAQLSAQDVAAVRAGTLERAEAIGRAARACPVDFDGDATGDSYLRMLGWMVREGLLEIRVGVPLDADGQPLAPAEARGYFHSKYGVLTDQSGDQVAFIGSENETASGWLYNHETFSVAPSWDPAIWKWQGADIVRRFEEHWANHPDAGWAILPLADVDDRLLKMVTHDYMPPDHDPIWAALGLRDPDGAGIEPEADPTEQHEEAAWADLVDLAQEPLRTPFTGALSAPVTPLPHQARLLHRAVGTYPRSYLFADPVGFGKTIEVGLVLRELLLSGKANNALILVPASVLKQWQEELAEKIGLLVPRYVGSEFLDLEDRSVSTPENSSPWSAFPIVLASSHLARRRARRDGVLAAGPWDVVVVDEAHHGRRRGSKPTDTPNSLLSLLLAMKDNGSWRALYLATATPMQMNPHEAWDLINLFDLPGRWSRSAADFVSYYTQLREEPAQRAWLRLAAMVNDYLSDPDADRASGLETAIKAELGPVRSRKITRIHNQPLPTETAAALSPTEVRLMDAWLRHHTPMRDRVFRNTRDTLLAYQAAGIIGPEVTIPERHVQDVFIDLDQRERRLYERIENYIRRYYNAYMAGNTTQALGFIMTVYRRRLTSSFYAIRCSLERRLAALEHGATLGDLLTDDDQASLDESPLFDVDDLDISVRLLEGEIAELRDFVADLATFAGEDTKASRLADDLAESLATYSSVVVFTQYTDTMDYVRERLLTAGYDKVGCYSGRGGELWDGGAWRHVSKAEVKDEFRRGGLHVLIGTDSMSEGLNLQTSGRLINYDMPWNLMRVEQRIGRVDRIGATYKEVRVTNYFYSDTVEEAVYRGIATNYGDFTDIVGSAQPVLGTIETAIAQLALTDAASSREQREADIDEAVNQIRGDIAVAGRQAVRLDDLGDTPYLDYASAEALALPDDVKDHGQVEKLRQRLLANPLTRDLLSPVPGRDGIYRYQPPRVPSAISFAPGSHPTTPEEVRGEVGSGSLLVTFDRDVADQSPDVLYATYGTPWLDAVLPAPPD
ncbi:phospholipase D-like protein [Kribbella steppae]|uniref:Phospholipase D-like protein n=1 Tax=Kribbella steppae TaxID=2512223 RepID=A0A4R2HTQ4_9ACTN|nr:helicase-related protein [Kribbella steppae]TCO33385.1 phospholipase D-like protein [Kribbella steppae]